jgi:hypothetical protein
MFTPHKSRCGGQFFFMRRRSKEQGDRQSLAYIRLWGLRVVTYSGTPPLQSTKVESRGERKKKKVCLERNSLAGLHRAPGFS